MRTGSVVAERADIVFNPGDSVTEAGEVDEDETFVARTGRTLGVGVLNLGVSGYGPQQELVVLKRYGLPSNPRLVVWQVTEWNDVLDAETYSLRGDRRCRRGCPGGPSTSARRRS